MPIIKVVGFDPALVNWGIVTAELDTSSLTITPVSSLLIETKSSKDKKVRKSSDRLRRGYELVEGIKSLDDDISIIFSEIPTGSQSAVAAFGLGIATGILASIKIPVIEVLPHQTKLASVGHKSASKQQVIDWCANTYPDLKLPSKGIRTLKKAEHIADAMAVICAGIETTQFKQLLNMYNQ